MKTIDPKSVSVRELHGYLLGAVAPRPIAFASTIDKEGNYNLSPFSYFNCFGANPPILIFSPARRGRDNTTKDTYENVREVPEVVINMVNYDIVEQMSLASTEYPKEVDEFVKSGLTPQPSERVKPPRVKESPVAFECIVKDVIHTGEEGGAGNLVVCEVVLMHINEGILTENGAIDPFKADMVARMGGNYYCRANGEALFEVPKPSSSLGIGFDQIPSNILESKSFSGNELGRLANISELPNAQDIKRFTDTEELKVILTLENAEERKSKLFEKAREYLKKGDTASAWKTLMM